MITLPLYFFLAIFLLYFLFFIFFSAANVYHIYSTATFTVPALFVTGGVVLWCLFVLSATFLAVNETNWQTSLVLLGPAGIISFQ